MVIYVKTDPSNRVLDVAISTLAIPGYTLVNVTNEEYRNIIKNPMNYTLNNNVLTGSNVAYSGNNDIPLTFQRANTVFALGKL